MPDERMSSQISIDTTSAKANIAELNRKMRVLESGFKASAASMGDWSKTSEGNEARMKSLNDIMGLQKAKIANLTGEYEKIVSEQGASSKAAQDLEIRINKEKEALGKNEAESRKASDALSELQSEAENASGGVEELSGSVEDAAPKTAKFQDAAGKLGGALKTGLAVTAKAAAAAVAAVGAAAVAASKQAFGFAQSAGEMADNLLTTSAQTGISAEKLQGWSYAARFIDTDVSTMTGSMAKMVKKMGDAAGGSKDAKKTFKELGVSIKDSNGNLRDSEDVFADAIDALGKIPDETKRDAMAMKLFGKSAQELNPLIEAGGDTLRELTGEAYDMGAVFSDEALTAMGEFDDSMQRAQATGEAMKNSIGLVVMPAFKPLVDTATDAMADVAYALNDGLQPGELEDMTGSLMSRMSTMIQDISGMVSQAIPFVSEALKGIVGVLAKELPGLVKTLLPAAMGLLDALVNAVVDNLDALVGLAVEIVEQLGEFLMKNAPKLFQAAIDIVMGLVDGITAHLPELIPLAITMMVKLAVALVKAVPQIIKRLPEILRAIWDGLLAVDWLALGTELVTAIWDSIQGIFKGLKWSLPKITLPKWVKNVLEVISSWWDKVKTWFWNGVTKADWSLPTITLPAWVTDVLPVISDWWDKAQKWFTDLVWSLPSIDMPTGADVIATVQGWADSALTWFKDLSFQLPGMTQPVTGEEIITKVQGWASDALNWFKGLSFTLPGVEQPVTGETIVNTVSGWASDALNWFKNLNFTLPEILMPKDGQGVVDTIKGWGSTLASMFDFDWSLPEITIPDSVKGVVDWMRDNIINPLKKLLDFNSTITVNYKQSSAGGGGGSGTSAWATGGIFTRETFFPSGIGSGGNIVGEKGAEGVLPLAILWKEMGNRFENALAKYQLNTKSQPIDASVHLTIQNLNGASNATIDYLAYALAARQKAALAGVGTIGT